MIVLGIEVKRPKGRLDRSFSKIKKQIWQEVARHWLDNIFRRHFGPANRAAYQHEPRKPVYVRRIKPAKGIGQGRFVDNVLTGLSKRFLQAFANVSGTGQSATLRMKGPAYFAKPFIGTYRKGPNLQHIRRQPDKPRELTTVDSRDRQDLADFAAKRLDLLIEQSQNLAKFTAKG